MKYEPAKISIKEQIDQGPVKISESGQPNFVHQGSNYFFGAPFSRPSGFVLPPAPDRVEVIEEDIFLSKPFVAKEKPPYINPIITVNGKEVITYPRLPLPLPNVSLSMQSGSFLPPFVNSYYPLTFPGLPILSKAPFLSTLVERPDRLSNDVIVSEVDVLVREIPPPPQLPPLKLKEIFQTVSVEEKKVILVPPPPAIEALFPPSILLAGQPCPPSLCARNIVFERVLPNIACEKSKKVELISIPASMRQPVVTTSFLPYIINH